MNNVTIIISVCILTFSLGVIINGVFDFIDEKREVKESKKRKIILREGYSQLLNKYGKEECFVLGEDDSWIEFLINAGAENKFEKYREMIAELNKFLGLESYVDRLIYFDKSMKYREIHVDGFMIVVKGGEHSGIKILYCRISE